MSAAVRRPRLLVIAVVLVLLALAAAGYLWWRSADTSLLSAAVAKAPADTARASWTDWSAVRRVLKTEPDLDSPDDVQAFLDDAFARDLSTSSALVESSPTLVEKFGFSPASVRWELLAQGPSGAVVLIGFGSGDEVEALADTLGELGYQRPDGDGRVWRGGEDLLPQIGPGLTPELQHFALLPDQELVITSDNAGFLADAVEAAEGEADGLAEADGEVTAVARGLGDAVAASVFTGDYACEHLAMASADEEDQALAEQLIAEAGGVHPLTAFAMGELAGGVVRVEMGLADEAAAKADAQARAELATGEAPGQGGTFADRFRVDRATAHGRVVRLDLTPASDAYVLSDLVSGPVLFATC